MNKTLVIICALLLYSLSEKSCFAQKMPDFLTAVQQGDITPTIKGKSPTGSYVGQAIEISVQNNRSERIETTVKKGTILQPENPETQRMIVSKDLPIVLQPNEYLDPPLYVFCTEFNKNAPTTLDNFSASHIATGDLLKLIEYIDQNGLNNDDAAQNAVWAITDNATTEKLMKKFEVTWDTINNNPALKQSLIRSQEILDNAHVNKVFYEGQHNYLSFLYLLLYFLFLTTILILVNKVI